MNVPENSLKIHSFYLIGKENYELGKYPDKTSNRNLPPTRFNFGETIQEIGLDIKLEYNNFKYYEENESIVAFEPFGPEILIVSGPTNIELHRLVLEPNELLKLIIGIKFPDISVDT